MAHHVLIPNKFPIIAISYPGSQGGYAVLPDRESGKSQKREYPDIIALPPSGTKTFDALLNESKGEFAAAQIERDIEKLMRYRTSEPHKAALNQFVVRVGVIKKTVALRKVVLGVGFGVKSTTMTWQPETIDFMFMIVNRERWRIGIFSDELKVIITKLNGMTDFPPCFTVTSEVDDNLFRDLAD